ncbi:MAG TPA: ASKHA domain-containing protein [Syntrophorhabdaceae bacterium]|nr:ASKHA domain-containing protein [Syntrophorhabdaceae bacterium]
MKRFKIRFLPIDIVYTAEEGENLLDFAMSAGININASCGGFGTCGRCRLKLIEGNIEYRGQRESSGSETDKKEDIILACQSYIKGDAIIEIPIESQIDKEALREKIKTKVLSARYDILSLNTIKPNPIVFKKLINIKLATCEGMDDLSSVIGAIKKEIHKKDIKVRLHALQTLPSTIRDANGVITVTLFDTGHYWELIKIESGDTTKRQYAIALDLGTTTICGRLIDITEKEKDGPRILEELSDYNAQISYGDDVITRIMHTKKKGGLKRLHDAVVKTTNSIMEELIGASGIKKEDIMFIVAAGNTTMTHLFLGVEPTYIMIEPYTPCFLSPPVVRAYDIGINLSRETPIFSFPCVSSYVGGDIVSGIVGSGLNKKDGVNLFIDIGTNGEIVLTGPDWMLCASCSAGPAFEGGGIKCGMRAAKGAIEQIRIDPVTFEPTVLTIGHIKPAGICGSGLIDGIAEMFLSGIILQNGKINRDLGSKRIRQTEGVYEYVICYGKDTLTGKDIVITESDLDNLMRAKAAMFAGCKVLVDVSGIGLDDIDKIIIAGGFGHFIDPFKAQIIGLFPELPVEKFSFIGNASLHGATLCALSKTYAQEAQRVAQMMTNIELSNNKAFMDEFIAAMFLPHTNERLFPNVIKKIKNSIGDKSV